MEKQAKDGTFYKQVGKDEWTPITRQAKDGTVYKKVGADDWSPLEAPKQDYAQAPKVSSKESALRGAAQGVSLGFADEAVGGIEALWEKAKGNPAEFGNLYSQYRDESRAKNKAAQEANPASYTSGEVGGAVASAFIPGGALAKGAKLAHVAGRAALTGGIAGAGYSEGENAVDIGKDVAAGAALGGTVGAVAPLVGRGISKVGDKAKSGAEWLSARAQGAERGTIKKLGAEKVKAAGRYGLDNKIISPLASTDDKIARNAALQKQGAEKMNQVYSAIDEAGESTFNPLEVASRVDEKIGGFYRSPINRGETNQLENTLESILMRGDKNIPLKDAQILKQELGKVANWKNNINVTDKERMAREAYGVVSQSIDEATESGAKKINNPDLLKTLKDGKSLYSASKTSEELLENKLAREQGNNLIGLTDAITGAGSIGYGGATGDWGTAAGIVLAKKGLGRYGAQNAALLLDKTGKALSKAPGVADKLSRNSALLERTAVQPLRPQFTPSNLKVAENEKPKKGYEKWANDGLEKLKTADKEGLLNDPKVIEKLKKNAKGQSLLIEAQEKGAKLDKILLQIKSSYLQGGE